MEERKNDSSRNKWPLFTYFRRLIKITWKTLNVRQNQTWKHLSLFPFRLFQRFFLSLPPFALSALIFFLIIHFEINWFIWKQVHAFVRNVYPFRFIILFYSIFFLFLFFDVFFIVFFHISFFYRLLTFWEIIIFTCDYWVCDQFLVDPNVLWQRTIEKMDFIRKL